MCLKGKARRPCERLLRSYQLGPVATGAAFDRGFALSNKKKKSCEPDGSSGVDLSHHLLPPSDGSIVCHLPHGVVLHNVANSKGGAGATFIEGFAVFTRTQEIKG